MNKEKITKSVITDCIGGLGANETRTQEFQKVLEESAQFLYELKYEKSIAGLFDVISAVYRLSTRFFEVLSCCIIDRMNGIEDEVAKQEEKPSDLPQECPTAGWYWVIRTLDDGTEIRSVCKIDTDGTIYDSHYGENFDWADWITWDENDGHIRKIVGPIFPPESAE